MRGASYIRREFTCLIGWVELLGRAAGDGENADAAIDAIYQDNPDKGVQVENHHAYIRVETDTECIIRRETMEATLGRSFHMHELETVLSSFAGQIETSAHHVRFYIDEDSLGRVISECAPLGFSSPDALYFSQ